MENLISMGFLAGNVEGMETGVYWADRSRFAAGMTKPGFWTDKMAHVCLDQKWLANAAIHFFFVTNFRLLEENFGPTGYRHVMLAAGRLGHRIYLAATALGLGCCGIGAFYDSEASDLLGLNEDSEMLYLLAAGPVKRSQ